MKKYLVQLRLSMLDLFEYRFDFVLHLIKYAGSVMLMSLVWIAVSKEGQSAMNQSQIVTYFTWGAILYSLSNFHTYYIEDDIKMGSLSRLLLKPMSVFGYYLSHQLGSALVETGIKIVVLIPFLIWFGWQVPAFSALILELAFLPLIYWVAFNIFSFISTWSFWLTEVFAIRWALTVTFRFFSGMFVPIALLPVWAQDWLWITPFPHMVNTPILLIQGQIGWEKAFTGWLVLAAWGVGLFFIREWVWKQGLQRYEHAGG